MKLFSLFVFGFVFFAGFAAHAQAATNLYAQIDDTEILPETGHMVQELGGGLQGNMHSVQVRFAAINGAAPRAELNAYHDELYTQFSHTITACDTSFNFSCRAAAFDPALYYH